MIACILREYVHAWATGCTGVYIVYTCRSEVRDVCDAFVCVCYATCAVYVMFESLHTIQEVDAPKQRTSKGTQHEWLYICRDFSQANSGPVYHDWQLHQRN